MINALPDLDQIPEGYVRHAVRLSCEGWPDHQYLKPVRPGGEDTRVCLNPENGTWVQHLLDIGLHVVWCTNWLDAVLPVVAAHGFPEIPVLAIEDLVQHRWGEASIDWKLRAITATFSGTPVCVK